MVFTLVTFPTVIDDNHMFKAKAHYYFLLIHDEKEIFICSLTGLDCVKRSGVKKRFFNK